MARRTTKLKEIRPGFIYPTPTEPLRIRVGVGDEAGFTKLDETVPPWPIEDGVVDQIFSSYHFHRLGQAGRYAFMDECWRVLKIGGQVTLVVPHWTSMRAISDPLAIWPPLCESSFMVYLKNWREAEKMEGPACDFGDNYGYGTTLDGDVGLRNDEYQAYARKHLVNANFDLHVTLTKPASK